MSTTTPSTGVGTETFRIGPDDDSTELEREIWAALDTIPDPHIPVSLVDMAMIYDVAVSDGEVVVTMTYPCMGCPAYDMIQNDIESCLRAFGGIDHISVEVTWDPVWSKDMLTTKARSELKDAGIGL